MKTSTRWITAAFILALMATACGADLSQLKPVIVVGTPAAEPKPQPEPAPIVPRATIAFAVVDDLTGQPIPSAIATFEDGSAVQANDDGYIAIEKELNTYQVKISADDYQTVTRNVVLTGNRQFTVRLTSTKPVPVPPKPEPPPAVDPPVVIPPAPVVNVITECGAAENTLRVSQGCALAVAQRSPFWKGCEAGSQRDCHYYTREVASALRIAQNDERWGIVAKPNGENVEGFAEDVVAYLPEPFVIWRDRIMLNYPKTWQWRGVDLVGGSGAPGARVLWGELHPAIKCYDGFVGAWCNREDMTWAPVPR